MRLDAVTREQMRCASEETRAIRQMGVVCREGVKGQLSSSPRDVEVLVTSRRRRNEKGRTSSGTAKRAGEELKEGR